MEDATVALAGGLLGNDTGKMGGGAFKFGVCPPGGTGEITLASPVGALDVVLTGGSCGRAGTLL